MATKTNTKAQATTTKAQAKAPQVRGAASHSNSSVVLTTGPYSNSPQAPLFTVGTLPPVQQGSHRAYAQQVARQLAKQHPKGFTLLQYRNALVAAAKGSTVAPPKHGWAVHNMPTWASAPAQQWLVPASK